MHPLMKRWLLLVCLVSAVCLGLPSVAGAQTETPTSFLYESCEANPPPWLGTDPIYWAMFGVTGFPPNTQFTGTIRSSDGLGVGPGTFTTGADGSWGPAGLGSSSPGVTWTWIVDSPYLGGTVTKTLTVNCEPTNVDQCKDGGYVGNSSFFGFRSQGECVAFVQRGPKPGAG
jgi:hypothetical protein